MLLLLIFGYFKLQNIPYICSSSVRIFITNNQIWGHFAKTFGVCCVCKESLKRSSIGHSLQFSTAPLEINGLSAVTWFCFLELISSSLLAHWLTKCWANKSSKPISLLTLKRYIPDYCVLPNTVCICASYIYSTLNICLCKITLKSFFTVCCFTLSIDIQTIA